MKELQTKFESFITNYKTNEDTEIEKTEDDTLNAEDDSVIEDKPKYEYDCLMLQTDLPEDAKSLIDIDEDDLYLPEGEEERYGIEDEHHVTILYGLHTGEYDTENLKSDVTEYLVENDLNSVNISLIGISIFENEKYDVVKFEVESDDCSNLNQLLQDNYPYTSDYPDYKAHITIAYVNKGEGTKYVESFTEPIFVSSTKFKLSFSKGRPKYFDVLGD
jgi:2'-5' RNA ligase